MAGAWGVGQSGHEDLLEEITLEQRGDDERRPWQGGQDKTGWMDGVFL